MTKKEQILQRQMDLFQFIKDNGHYGFKLSNDAIYEKMARIYSSKRLIQRDLNTLQQKFLIAIKLDYVNPTWVNRIIKVVNRNKELLSQCNYDYLEELALANPHCFLVKWRDGYDYKEGGIQKYLDNKNSLTHIGTKWDGTGMFLLKEPSNLLSSKPISHKNAEINSEDHLSYLDHRPLAF